MALTPYNDNFDIKAPKPLDSRAYSSGSLTPYSSALEASASILYKYEGLPIYVSSSIEELTEYWWKNGQFIPKIADDTNKVEKSTGYIDGLELSINSNNSASFDISSGYYFVTEYTDKLEPESTLYFYSGSNANSLLYLSSSNASYIAINKDGDIIQDNSPFDNDDRRHLCIVGTLLHPNRNFIENVNEFKAPLLASTNQMHDIIEAIGPLNLTGNIYNYSGSTGLGIEKSAGKIWGLGINALNYEDPHRITLSGSSPLTWRYRLQEGTEYSDTNNIDPNNYDLSGVLTSVPAGKFTVQRINLFQDNSTRIQYGQAVYDTLNDARYLLQTEPFIKEPNIAEDAIFRSYLIIKQGTTDLSSSINAESASFVPVDKFGNLLGSAGVSITYNTVVEALGYVPENEDFKVQTLSGSNSITYPSTAAISSSIENGLNITSNGKIRLGGTLLENTNVFIPNNINLNLTAISSSYIAMQWDRSGDLLDYNYNRFFVNPFGITLQSLKYFYYTSQFHSILLNTGSIFLGANNDLNLRLSSLPDASPNDYILFQESGSDDITGLQVRKASTIPASYITGLNYVTTSSFNTFTSSFNIPQYRVVLGNNNLVTSSNNLYYSGSTFVITSSKVTINDPIPSASFDINVGSDVFLKSNRFLVGNNFIAARSDWEPGTMFNQWKMIVSTGSVGAALFESRIDIVSYPISHSPSLVISTNNFASILTIGVAGSNFSWGSLTRRGEAVLTTRANSSLILMNSIFISGSTGNVVIGNRIDRGQKLQVEGIVRISSLSGSGTRMVVADATGSLFTQEIPSGGSGSGGLVNINNNSQYRLLVANGTTSSIEAYSELTYSGSIFNIIGTTKISSLQSQSNGILRSNFDGTIFAQSIVSSSIISHILGYNTSSNEFSYNPLLLSNGIEVSGSSFVLGGTLSRNTEINTNGFNFNITGSGDFSIYNDTLRFEFGVDEYIKSISSRDQFQRFSMTNTNSGSNAGIGTLMVNNSGHSLQIFKGSSNNVFGNGVSVIRNIGGGDMRLGTDTNALFMYAGKSFLAAVGDRWGIRIDSASVKINDKVFLNKYGSGSYSGSSDYLLGISGSGQILEIPFSIFNSSSFVEYTSSINNILSIPNNQIVFGTGNSITSSNNITYVPNSGSIKITGLSQVSSSLVFSDGSGSLFTYPSASYNSHSQSLILRSFDTGQYTLKVQSYTLGSFSSGGPALFESDYDQLCLNSIRSNGSAQILFKIQDEFKGWIGFDQGKNSLRLRADGSSSISFEGQGAVTRAHMTNQGRWLLSGSLAQDTGQILQVFGGAKITGLSAPTGSTYLVSVNDQGILSSIPVSGSSISGSLGEPNKKTVYSNYTLEANDDSVYVDSTSGNIILTIDPLLTSKFQYIKKISDDSNLVILSGSGGALIEFEQTYSMEYRGQKAIIQASGSNIYLW